MNTLHYDLNFIIRENQKYIDQFVKSDLMVLVEGKTLDSAENRDTLFDCLQTFSNQFQNTVMLRASLTTHKQSMSLAQEHFAEEYGHHLILQKERKNKPSHWDPILEATTAWFSFQMLILDNIEKTLLIHLVLESSANIFFQQAARKLKAYNCTNYFEIHAENDEHHENMGKALLSNLREDEYRNLLLIQKKGWEILITACNRIATICQSQKNRSTTNHSQSNKKTSENCLV